MENKSTKGKTKGNVTVRCRAVAAERLDLHLATYPYLKEPEVVAAALDHYFDALAAAPLAAHEAEKLETPTPITVG